MAKLEIALTLEQHQLDWLQSMAKKHNLPTADKALRIVIMYLKQIKDSADATLKELSSNSHVEKNPVSGNHAIDQVQDSLLDEVMITYNLSSKDKVVHLILEYAMSNVDERTLFEVKRCRHGETCKNC